MLFVFTLTHSVLVALALIRSTFGMDIKKKGYLLLRECHAFPAQEKINEVTPKPHPVVKKWTAEIEFFLHCCIGTFVKELSHSI